MNNLYRQLQTQMQSQPPQQVPQPSNNQKLFTQQNPLKKNNLLSQFLKSSNPKETIQNMVMSNPKMQNVMQLFQNSNLTPKQFFYQYAEQKGVDPEQFINSL